jgi:hypothetical protein
MFADAFSAARAVRRKRFLIPARRVGLALLQQIALVFGVEIDTITTGVVV